MTTALTLYGSNVASTTLGTASQMPIATGGTEISTTTTAPAFGNGYIEILAQGGSAVLYNSLPAPTGYGWLYDSTALEGQTITASSMWSAVVGLADTLAPGPVTSIQLRAYKRSAAGVYSSIGIMSVTNTSIATTRTTYSLTTTNLASMSFATGDKLYFDLFVNANNWNADPILCYQANSATAGVANDMQVTTPGYSTTLVLVLTNAGHNLLRDGSNNANNPMVKYIAVGDSSTAPTVNDTRLGNEIFRKAVTSRTNGFNPGELLINVYLSPGDTIGTNIQEVGFFGGNSAGTAANSGVMLARGLYAHGTKSGLESIQLQLDLTL